jgi:hypothetical protein
MLVAECLVTKNATRKGALNLEMVQKFSHQAHHCVLAYFYVELELENYLNEEGLH